MKLGFQAPVGARYKTFNHVHINDTDLSYCISHKFVYDSEYEQKKLYNGEACFYTDERYIESLHNFYKSTYLYFSRARYSRGISLKAAIRLIRSVRNIPVGTIIDLRQDWYIPGKNIDFGYKYKIKEFNEFNPNYQINKSVYTNNFTNDKKSNELVNLLRKNGFIVSVNVNDSFILSMINIASKFTGKEEVDSKQDGEIATAYGNGKIIGFSSFKNDYRGYSNGVDNILWDNFGEFNKWSRCEEVSKELSNKEIIEIFTK